MLTFSVFHFPFFRPLLMMTKPAALLVVVIVDVINDEVFGFVLVYWLIKVNQKFFLFVKDTINADLLLSLQIEIN